MRIIGISDTHGQHQAVIVPAGDVLVHAGDCTEFGRLDELFQFCRWFAAQKPMHKILVAGNHDWCFESSNAMARAICREFGVHYLQDEEVVIDGVRFYGSPWTPKFMEWAFMRHRGELKPIWDRIPDGTNVLVTHGPPMGKLDWSHYSRDHSGCIELREAVERVKPQLHCFGHIHLDRGAAFNGETVFLNCCICNESYEPVNTPQAHDLEVRYEEDHSRASGQ